MSQISGVGGTPPPEPPHHPVQSEQRHEVEVALNYFSSIMKLASENNGNIPTVAYAQALEKLETIVNDPHMPASLKSKAQSLINMLTNSSTIDGNETHVNLNIINTIVNQLQGMYDNFP